MSYNPMSLAGKTILVTGASSGIGRAIAIECSKLGASVIATGRNEERLAETLTLLDGEGHSSFAVDLSTEDGLSALVADLPKLDGVAHVAGISDICPAPFISAEKLDRMLDVNLKSPILLQARLLQGRKIAKNASLVFMASVAGIQGAVGNAMYASAKAGVIAYMRVLTRELASKKIRANCILPAMIETPMTLGEGVVFSKEQYEDDVKRYPLGRYGKPEEVAHLAAFLLSNAASWITGCNYVIDGGLTRR